jgi:hypothetical protein
MAIVEADYRGVSRRAIQVVWFALVLMRVFRRG